ncbi:MAG: hypothetical protein [Olavius algarvensis Gamma 1 endosymbiont]|nr:MAG: hypothetical protein [Olavius algarvensis Gamma 1 endosymbiont]
MNHRAAENAVGPPRQKIFAPSAPLRFKSFRRQPQRDFYAFTLR